MFTLEDHINPTRLEHCSDLHILSRLLGVRRDYLLKLLYSENRLYYHFDISKKNGDKRTIHAPIEPLKNLQRKIKVELEKYYIPRGSTHGFVKKRNIITNATPHLRKRHVFNIDLADFFGTITFGRVQRVLQSSPFNMPYNVATVVAQICCHEGALPQGAPTSPIVSNIIAFKLDNQLLKLAQKYRCTYTRYADDISFSFRQQRNKLPEAIVSFNGDKVIPGAKLTDVISKNGFKINSSKTRLQSKQNRQAVTNITVNEKLNVNRRFLRRTSSMLNAALRYGFPKAESVHFEHFHSDYIPPRHSKKMHEEPGLLFRQKLRGRLNFIREVRGKSCPVWRKLMYMYTVATEEPNEDYNLSIDAITARSTVVIWDLSNSCGETFSGSGFMLKGAGLVTNQHVVKGIISGREATELQIDWLEKKCLNFLDARIVIADGCADVALITSSIADRHMEPLDIEPYPDYSVGRAVKLIGYPDYREGDTFSVTDTVIVREYGQADSRRIEVREQIFHGMSGGVVLNEDGRVIGIVSNGIKYGTTSQLPSSFIPISTLTAKVTNFRKVKIEQLLSIFASSINST